MITQVKVELLSVNMSHEYKLYSRSQMSNQPLVSVNCGDCRHIDNILICIICNIICYAVYNILFVGNGLNISLDS
jgi:hypothetical protein